MRVNWFSSLPPVNGPAALYTARVLPFLKSRAEVVLWTPQAHWDRVLERWAEIRSFHSHPLPWVEINQADATIYHLAIGDPEASTLNAILEQHPGIGVMHSPHPSDSVLDRCLGLVTFERDSFEEWLGRGRRPVLLAPLPWSDSGDHQETLHALTAYKDHVETLLTFADESRLFSQRLTGEDLARRAAKQMSLWTSDADRAPELPRTVQEIMAITSRSAGALLKTKPRAA